MVNPDECRVAIEYLSEEIGKRLRRHNQAAKTVSLTVKDEYLRSIQRQRSLPEPTDIAKEISDIAYDILLKEWSPGKPIRMITVSAANLVRQDMVASQMSFFETGNETKRIKSKKIEETVDNIRQRFGEYSIVNGAIIDTDIGIYDQKTIKK